MIPLQWRYWWVDTLPTYFPEYHNISICEPSPILVDRTTELSEWNQLISSNSLPKISLACNKYMIPCILCPWGCSEFNFHSGFLPLDIIFQRYLMKVNIDLIEDVSQMKYARYARDDYLRFSGNYEEWLFNPLWKVTPSISFVEGKGMKFMTCKDHNNGSISLFLHPPRQPNHILPCKYSDQICHAVIKPRTISQMKAQKYSNNFQMHKQRGNFNGIDTCSITQFRNFKIISYLLQENESRSICGCPYINSLLHQFVKEN